MIETALDFENDYRLISLIFSWIKVHGNYVVIEKLSKKLKQKNNQKLNIYFTALAAFAIENKFYKWKKLLIKFKSNEYLMDKKITDSAIDIKGAISYFKKHKILIAEGSLRIREDDVSSPSALAKKNKQYRNRLLYGPCWRADIITAIENGAKNPYEISKLIGCSYEPAYRVFMEYSLARGA